MVVVRLLAFPGRRYALPRSDRPSGQMPSCLSPIGRWNRGAGWGGHTHSGHSHHVPRESRPTPMRWAARRTSAVTSWWIWSSGVAARLLSQALGLDVPETEERSGRDLRFGIVGTEPGARGEDVGGDGNKLGPSCRSDGPATTAWPGSSPQSEELLWRRCWGCFATRVGPSCAPVPAQACAVPLR